jgi:mono/diheme cytochrome c family protein
MMAGAARSQDHLAHERGATIVEQWCRLCHVRAADKPGPDMAPAFEKLVRRPGRDREFYARFMAEDHFPMTTFRLFDDEKQSVIEYLLSLQQR